jgi:hypothetical protein
VVFNVFFAAVLARAPGDNGTVICLSFCSGTRTAQASDVTITDEPKRRNRARTRDIQNKYIS